MFSDQNTTLELTKLNSKTNAPLTSTTIILKPRRTGSGVGSKQRSFTTSILVSSSSDKKFAARQNKQLSIEENTKTASTTYSNDLLFNKPSLNSKKFCEKSRSYQRLTQDEIFLNENKNDEKLNNENPENKISFNKCSGNKIIVDIKKVFFFNIS